MNKTRGIFKKSLIIFLIGIFSPIIALATGNDTNSLEGPDMSSPGETITYDIKVKASSTIDKYTANLSYESTVLEFVGVENKDDWKAELKNEGTRDPTTTSIPLEFTRESGYIGETTVATIKFKVKSDATKSDAKLTLSGTIGFETTISNLPEVTKTIAIKSTDNTLKDLKLNGKTVINFSPNTYSYSIQVEAITTSAAIDATLNNQTATFTDKYGPRSVQLDYGENVIEIKVKAASGDEKTYVINVTRLDNRGTNNDLKSLILNSGKVKLNFDKNVLEYKIKTHKLTSIDIEAVPVDSKATVKVEKPEEIIIGENTINITVTSEDGKDKTYKVTFNNVDYDIDTSLKDIELFGCDEELKFDPKVFDYEIRYNSKYKDSLVIKPILNTTDEDVKIDEPLLEKTSSTIEAGTVIQIRVYAIDGTESMYTITLVKDTRINFFFLLGLVIFIILLIIFIKLLIDKKKNKGNKKYNYRNFTNSRIRKTKRLQKINLE